MMRNVRLPIVCALLLSVLTACGAPTVTVPRTTTAPQTQATAPEAAEQTQATAAEAAEQIQQTAAEDTEQTTQWGRTVHRDGKTYRYNSRLRTCLFLGVDSRAQVHASAVMGSGGRSDTMMLFIIDPDTQTIQLMPISRDTITEVKVYDRDRNYMFSGDMQITMQYAFGDSSARSCKLTERAVSALLHGIPIDYYCSLTLDGIAAAVNAVGGITLTLEEDWTDIDPTYTAGSTITMDGAAAERFLRYRDTAEDASNNDRMRRQTWFINCMFSRLAEVSYEPLLDLLDPYLETDLDADTLHQFKSYTLQPEILTIPGKDVRGEEHDEFYVDDAALQELLLRTFYHEVE